MHACFPAAEVEKHGTACFLGERARVREVKEGSYHSGILPQLGLVNVVSCHFA